MNNDINLYSSVIPIAEEGLVKRLIVASYKDKCNLCFGDINVGEQIAWYGKGFGVRHLDCYMKRDTLLTNEEFDKLSQW
jgi:hypothetical protein